MRNQPKDNKSSPNDINTGPNLIAKTPSGRENELVSLAYDLVEKRLREGTATSQETVHFLKLGSTKERLEKDKLQLELELVKAKTEALQSTKRLEELYANAMKAFQEYSGEDYDDDPDVY